MEYKISIQKFCNYLENFHEEMKMEIIEEASTWIIQNQNGNFPEELLKMGKVHQGMSDLLSLLKDNYDKNSREIFNEFCLLSTLLEEFKMNAKECTAVIFYVIKKNLQTNMLQSNAKFVGAESLENYHFNTMDKNEACEIITSIGTDDFEEKYGKDPKIQEKLKELLFHFLNPTNTIKATAFRKNHSIIKSSYFEKEETFDEKDITNIIDSLERLGITEKIAKYVEITLKKKYQKRKKEPTVQKISFTEVKPKKKGLSNKEYKEIRKELEKYYNLHQNKILLDLTNEEMIHCISLMYQLGIEEEIIDNFIKKAKSNISSPKNPITNFTQNFEKINYYQNKEMIQEIKNNLLECMENIFIVDDEEYLWMKEEIEAKMKLAQDLLKDNYDYEKSTAKALIKKWFFVK